jgi:hypothetical protein
MAAARARRARAWDRLASDLSSGYQYKVVQVREGLIGGKMSGDKLGKILKEQGSSGWQVKAPSNVRAANRLRRISGWPT